MGNLSKAQVLVIGASGFLGGRLAERLVLECSARVRTLVRRVGVTRLARLPLEVAVGDVLDPRTIASAAQGCSVIFNCAKGTGADAVRRRATEVEGVRNAIEAARSTGARVVQVSSLAVYDIPSSGDITERTPPAPKGDSYSDAKLEGERLALELGANLDVPVVVLQPTVVYGPEAGVHGTEVLGDLRASRVINVDGGAGICNAVYVDDVVTAMLLAAASDRAPGERFLISGPEHPTWGDFFMAFEQMLGLQRMVTMSEDEALAFWHQTRRRPSLVRTLREDRTLRARLVATREGGIIRRLIEHVYPASLSPERWSEPSAASGQPNGEPPLKPLRPWVVRYRARKARVQIHKAREVLGYEPRFRMEDGMRLTKSWARWAGLLG